jgi:hypothetical protein
LDGRDAGGTGFRLHSSVAALSNLRSRSHVLRDTVLK